MSHPHVQYYTTEVTKWLQEEMTDWFDGLKGYEGLDYSLVGLVETHQWSFRVTQKKFSEDPEGCFILAKDYLQSLIEDNRNKEDFDWVVFLPTDLLEYCNKVAVPMFCLSFKEEDIIFEGCFAVLHEGLYNSPTHIHKGGTSEY